MIIQYKSKQELDSLETYDAVNSYRRDILRSDNTDWKEYVDELRIYMDIRFVDRVFEQYEEWSQHKDEAAVLITKSIEMLGGPEKYYNGIITMMKKNLENKYKLY